MSKITITVDYRGNKYQLQFQDDLNINAVMGELRKIPILLDFTPRTLADWQDERASQTVLGLEKRGFHGGV